MIQSCSAEVEGAMSCYYCLIRLAPSDQHFIATDGYMMVGTIKHRVQLVVCVECEADPTYKELADCPYCEPTDAWICNRCGTHYDGMQGQCVHCPPEPTFTLAQVQDEKRKLVEEIAKNVQDYFAAGEAIDNCASDKELDNWRYIREIAEFIKEGTKI